MVSDPTREDELDLVEEPVSPDYPTGMDRRAQDAHDAERARDAQVDAEGWPVWPDEDAPADGRVEMPCVICGDAVWAFPSADATCRACSQGWHR